MNAKTIKEFVGNKIFTVTFTKKDGTIRNLNGRIGVIKHLKGGDKTVPESYVVVYDLVKKAYRCFNPETVIKVKCGKELVA